MNGPPRMKGRKASGLDKIAAEFFKKGGEASVERLPRTLITIITLRTITGETHSLCKHTWLKRRKITINYSRISLLSILGSSMRRSGEQETV